MSGNVYKYCFSSSAETLATPSTISSREPPVSTKPDYVSTIKTAFILYIRKNIVSLFNYF